MNRYLLFSCDDYDADGGWGDFRSDHEHLEDALAAAVSDRRDRWHVVDLTAADIVDWGCKR